jgi:hypothetical protein
MRRICGRHGRREQRDLAGWRCLLEHCLDIIDEAHAQHFVGLVEHQALELDRSRVPRSR